MSHQIQFEAAFRFGDLDCFCPSIQADYIVYGQNMNPPQIVVGIRRGEAVQMRPADSHKDEGMRLTPNGLSEFGIDVHLDFASSGLHQKRIHAVIIRVLGELRLHPRSIKAAMPTLPPRIDLLPRKFAPPYCQKAIPMLFNPDRNYSVG